MDHKTHHGDDGHTTASTMGQHYGPARRASTTGQHDGPARRASTKGLHRWPAPQASTATTPAVHGSRSEQPIQESLLRPVLHAVRTV